MKPISNFKLAVLFLFWGVVNFSIFGYDIENDRDLCTWLWLLTAIISFIGAIRFFVLSDRVDKKVSYFILFYSAKGDFEGYNIGNISFFSSKPYLNNKEAVDFIKSRNPKFDSVVINNFIEVSESQYNCFVY